MKFLHPYWNDKVLSLGRIFFDERTDRTDYDLRRPWVDLRPLSLAFALLSASTIAHSQITLSWNDNSTNEDGFRIERSIDGAAYAEIAVVGANTATYQDVMVIDNQVYTYRVRAFNAYGNSGYSNAATGASGTISTTEADTISISFSGLQGGVYEPGQSDAFQISVEGAQSTVQSVQFFVNGTIVSTKLQDPYDFVFQPTTEGTHLLKAMVATDLGVYEKSVEVTVESGSEIPSGSIAILPLDEGSGTLAGDASGSGNNGTLLGGASFEAVTADGSPSAVRFDGLDDYIDLGNLDVGGSGLSIAAWLKADSFPGSANDPRIVSKATSTDNGDHVFMLSTIISGGETRLRARVRVGGVTRTLIADSGSLSIGQWHHAAATYDGAALRLYLDGVQVGFTALSGPVDTDPSVPVAVGSQPPGAGDRFFDGLLDDVRILNRALSQAEIDDILIGGSVVDTENSNQPTISKISDISILEGGTSGPIEFTIGDAETSSDSLTVEAVSSNTELLPNASISLDGSGSSRTISIAAPENSTGKVTVTVSVSDGEAVVSQSFVVSIVGLSAPSITQIPDVKVYEGDSLEPIAFVVGDAETPAEALLVTATTSNELLLPQSAVTISGTGSNRTISLAPVAQAIGESLVTVIVDDGTSSVSESFWLLVSSGAPEIMREPEDLVELNGGITAFSVEAAGKPELSYQWFFNDNPIAGASQASYLIEGVSTQNAGSYKVQVSNPYGAAQSRSATLTVQSSITDTQTSIVSTTDESGQLILSVEESGDNLTYQWYQGASGDKSNPIEGATGSSFSPPDTSEGSSYWVEVTVDSGSASNVDVAQSDTFVVEGESPELDRYFFGEFSDGTMGKFGLYVRPDNTAVFLGHIESRKSIIASVSLEIKADGSFNHRSREFGWINGVVGETSVSGGVAKKDLTFSGSLSVLDGMTGAIAGFYDGVIANTADGQTFLLAGPNGEAYVISGSGNDYTSYEGTVSADGLITVSVQEEEYLSLSIDIDSKTLSGTTIVDSEERSILGQSENMDTDSELYNASIRAQVKGGSSVMIAGFVVLGPEEKQVLIRGVGPSLRSQGVRNALSDPRLTLYRQGTEEPIGFNDNWRDSENASQIEDAAAHAGAFALPAGSMDSALLVSLPQGVYTAHVESANGSEGTSLVEIYDADSAFGIDSRSTLVNMSLRGEIGTGDNVIISGFVVEGTSSKRMLVRAVGPELSQFGITNALEDPQLTIYQSKNGEMLPIAESDDWGEDGINAINASESGSRAGAFPLEVGSKSAAKVVWLTPGLYTAVASGVDGQTGIALVEAYEIE